MQNFPLINVNKEIIYQKHEATKKINVLKSYESNSLKHLYSMSCHWWEKMFYIEHMVRQKKKLHVFPLTLP